MECSWSEVGIVDDGGGCALFPAEVVVDNGEAAPSDPHKDMAASRILPTPLVATEIAPPVVFCRLLGRTDLGGVSRGNCGRMRPQRVPPSTFCDVKVSSSHLRSAMDLRTTSGSTPDSFAYVIANSKRLFDKGERVAAAAEGNKEEALLLFVCPNNST
jgi:hypothetical protein